MHPLHRFPLLAAVLAMGLAVSLPSTALARSEGHGKRNRARVSEARGGPSGKREYFRGGADRSSGRRADVHRVEGRERAARRGPGDRRVEWRDSGRRVEALAHRSRTRYRDDRPGYSDYVHRPRAHYAPRSYYTASFHRPRFISHSGFSLGLVIGAVPSRGYRYFDPYCEMGFSHLGAYYDHCYHHGHPDAILVIDVHSGYPIASCAYRGGYWVVDDCY